MGSTCLVWLFRKHSPDLIYRAASQFSHGSHVLYGSRKVLAGLMGFHGLASRSRSSQLFRLPCLRIPPPGPRTYRGFSSQLLLGSHNRVGPSHHVYGPQCRLGFPRSRPCFRINERFNDVFMTKFLLYIRSANRKAFQSSPDFP